MRYLLAFLAAVFTLKLFKKKKKKSLVVDMKGELVLDDHEKAIG